MVKPKPLGESAFLLKAMERSAVLFNGKWKVAALFGGVQVWQELVRFLDISIHGYCACVAKSGKIRETSKSNFEKCIKFYGIGPCFCNWWSFDLSDLCMFNCCLGDGCAWIGVCDRFKE